MAPYIKDRRYLAGLLLVAIGMLLIIENIKFIPDFIPWWVWTWQFLLITIGVFSLLTSENTTPGIVLVSIGTLFLLSDVLPWLQPWLYNVFNDVSSLFWYLIIIIIGISLIIRGRHRTPGSPESKGGRHYNPSAPRESTQDYIDELAIFGGADKIITTDNFKGGKITTMFGGADVKLLHSELAPGTHTIDVFSMFGGFTIVVPPHWQVKIDVVAVFGGVDDKRYPTPDSVKDNTRQLVIKGLVLFGGGEIKSI